MRDKVSFRGDGLKFVETKYRFRWEKINPRKNDCAQTLLYKAEHKNSQADTFIALLSKLVFVYDISPE